ncbi:hypothetical protein TMEN_3761 [Trichophyton mentagrophytes]|nr:hypothetical protein TMEN_3761 [Trichophyton mentagrophytes]
MEPLVSSRDVCGLPSGRSLMEETEDVLRFVHLRMAIFGLKKAGWSVAPVLEREVRELYDRIMQPVRAMCSEAAIYN